MMAGTLFDQLPVAAVVDRFDDFWKAWPSNERKAAKKQCKAKWDRLGCNLKADHIIKAVGWFKTTKTWADGFVPAPLVWLNQERWEAYAPEAEAPRLTDVEKTKLYLEQQRRDAEEIKAAAIRARLARDAKKGGAQ